MNLEFPELKNLSRISILSWKETKIGKIKIVGLASEEYPEGRWDIFKVNVSNDLIALFVELFKDFGFKKPNLLDLDMDYTSLIGFHTFYSPKVKVYFYREKDILNGVFP